MPEKRTIAKSKELKREGKSAATSFGGVEEGAVAAGEESGGPGRSRRASRATT